MAKRTWQIRDDDTIFDMLRMYNNLSTTFKPLHDDMTADFNMTVAKLMWRPEWKKKLDLEGRPAFAYNLLRPVINVITAVELANRKRIIAKPTGEGDAKLAEVVTQVLLHFLYKSDFDWHRTRVFLNAIIAKYGVYHLGWNYDDNPLGQLEVTAIDPRRVMFELNYADSTWEKANYIYDRHQLSFEEIINKFALNDDELQNAIIEEAKVFFEEDSGKRDKWLSKRLKALFSAAYEVMTEGDSSTPGPVNSSILNWFDPLTGKFDVLEFHEKRTERRLLIHDSNRQKDIDITEHAKGHNEFEFDNEKIGLIKQNYGIIGEPRTELANKKFVTAVVPAFRLKVNEQPYPFNIKNWVYVPNYAYDYHADLFHAQSVIDDLIDPQSDYNKARSTKLELLQRYVNKGWILEEGAIDGLEPDWETNRLVPYRRVRTGWLNKVQPEEGQTISPDLIRELGEAPMLIEQISNAKDSIKGDQETSKESGKHFIAKKNQQERSFSYLFNNVDHSSKAVGKVSLAMIQAMVTTSRVFRIKAEEANYDKDFSLAVNQAQYSMDPFQGRLIKQIANDITIGEYDIQIDTTPYSTSAREIEFEKMTELFEATAEINPKKADAMLPLLVKAGDFPYSDEILEAWEALEGGDPQQQAMAQQMQQFAIQLQQIMAKLGIEEKKADIMGKHLDNMKKKSEIRNMAKMNVLGMMDSGGNGYRGSNSRTKKQTSYKYN